MDKVDEPVGAKTRHFYELDSLRGLAAVVVMFWHFTIAFPRPWLTKLSQVLPGRLLFEGHQAVVLFFVLSGFVLTLPALRGKQPSYPTFVLKRILRIYVPYLGAMALALCGDALLHGPTRAGSSWQALWANQTWTAPINASLLAHQLFFLGNYDWAQVGTAFWSLVIELRVSLVFPLLLVAVLSLRSRWVLLGTLGLTLASRPLANLFSPWIDLNPQATTESLTFITVHYTSMFVLGSLLAKNLDRVTAWYQRMHRWGLLFLLPVAIVLYDGFIPAHVEAHSLPQRFTKGSLLFRDQLHDWPTTAGALLLIVLAIHLRPFQKLLHIHLVHHLGKVSYSLYLVHGTVLFSLMHLLPQAVPAPLAFVLYVMGTLLLTEGFYRLVELPSMHLGKRVGTRARQQKATFGLTKEAV